MSNPLSQPPSWEFDGGAFNGPDTVQVSKHKEVLEDKQGTWTLSITPTEVDKKQGVLSKDAQYFGDGGHLTLYIDNGLLLARAQNTSKEVVLSGGTIREGETYDIAFAYGPKGIALYVNGKKTDDSSFVLDMRDNAEDVVIGANQWASGEGKTNNLKHFFEGTIDNVAFYDAQASASDVATWAEMDDAPAAVETSAKTEPAPELAAAALTSGGGAAPEIVATPGRMLRFDEGATKIMNLAKFFSDPDGDTLSFKLQDGPGYAEISGGSLVMKPDGADSGDAVVSVVAFDGASYSEALDIKVRVADTLDGGSTTPDSGTGGTGSSDDTGGASDNTAPIVIATPGRTYRVDEGDRKTINLNNFFSDSDGDALSFDMSSAPGFATIQGKNLILTPGNNDSSNGSFNVKAYDGQSYSETVQVNYVIRDTDGSGGGSTDGGTGGSGSGGGSNPPPPNAGKSVSLLAEQGSLSGSAGKQLWDDGVTLAAYNLSGALKSVSWNTEHKDQGFGVPGGRWSGQIDYSEKNGGTSEKIVVDFNGLVDDVIIFTGMLGLDEGPNINGSKVPETGKWTAYDAKGNKVDTGLIGPDLSALGKNKKVDGSYGVYPIEVDAPKAIASLVIEATQWGHGKGYSLDNRKYGENNSDFALTGLEYVRLDYDDLG